MQLDKLSKTQDVLDKRIMKEKGLEIGNDYIKETLLVNKILALQVELGELANEWRGFKFWSEDQEPRDLIHHWFDTEGEEHKTIKRPTKYDNCILLKTKNPLLEEYVDCLHFFLSIGNDIGCDGEHSIKQVNNSMDWILENRNVKETPIVEQFNVVFHDISNFASMRSSDDYYIALSEFFILGEKLGFTDQQVEQAYFEKNQINHDRQVNGY